MSWKLNECDLKILLLVTRVPVFSDMVLLVLSNYHFVSILKRHHYIIISGLKDLADFLPASLATIVSYFSAEVTRGLWKPAFMNGTDWPSPAANLSMVEQQIHKILAATGVNVPCVAEGVYFWCCPYI